MFNYFYLPIAHTVTSIYVCNIPNNISVISVCALIEIPYNVKPTNALRLFIYFIIHLCSIQVLLMFSNSLKMIKAYRNMSKSLRKYIVLTLEHLLVRLCEQLAKLVSEPRNFPMQV